MSFTVNTLRNVTTACQQMRDHIKTIVFRPDNLSTAEQKSAIRRRKTRPSCYMPGGVA